MKFTAIIDNTREVTETVAWMPSGETLAAFRTRVDASLARAFAEMEKADYPKPSTGDES